MIPLPVKKFSKKPDEVLPRLINYANKLPEGTNLDSVVVTATDALGNDITSVVIVEDSEEIITETQQAKFYVQGGAEGLRASIKVTVSLDDTPATVLVDYLTMLVKELP